VPGDRQVAEPVAADPALQQVHQALIGQPHDPAGQPPESDAVALAESPRVGRAVEGEEALVIFEDVAGLGLAEPCEQIDLGLQARQQGLDGRGAHRGALPACAGTALVAFRSCAAS
jgi:hypothetical protein